AKESWPGVENQQLRDGLVDYYKGRPYDLTLNAEISKIVYDAGLPRPAAGILKDLNASGSDKELYELSEKIKARYGENAVATVNSNIAMLNALPPPLRLQLLSQGMPELSDVEEAALAQQVNPLQVVAQLEKGVLQDSNNRNLLTDLSPQTDALGADAQKRAWQSRKELETQLKERGTALSKLDHQTYEGVSWARRASFLLFDDPTIYNFEIDQTQNVHDVRVAEHKLTQAAQANAIANQEEAFYSFGRDVHEYTNLRNSGNTREADKLAIALWQQHGPLLAEHVPTLWRDLNVSDGTVVGRSILSRMQAQHLARVSEVPSYEVGDKGFAQALDTLKSFKYEKPEEYNYVDDRALKNHALGRLESDENISKMLGSGQSMQQDLEAFKSMFAAAQHGTKYDSFCDLAKEKAEHLRNALDQVDPKAVQAIKERIAQMNEALSQVKDFDVQRELQARIDSYTEALKLFDPSEDLNQKLRQMVNEVSSPNFRADSALNWFKTNGALIGASVLTAALTVTT
ncbi:MAG: hypothetical protein ACRD3W_14285, partial [Terriglobales bacterium]